MEEYVVYIRLDFGDLRFEFTHEKFESERKVIEHCLALAEQSIHINLSYGSLFIELLNYDMDGETITGLW